MRYTIAVAAFAGLVAAVPQGYYGGEAPAAPAYPVETTPAGYAAYPVETPAAPAYPAETPEAEYPAVPAPSSEAWIAPSSVHVPEAAYPTSTQEAVYPVETPAVPEHENSSEIPVAPTTSVSATVPAAEESCLSSTTITVTVPYPTASGDAHCPGCPKPTGPAGEVPAPSGGASPSGAVPHGPAGPSGTAPAGEAPYPSMPAGPGAPGAPYPVVPSGTAPGGAAPTGTGAYIKPSTPAEFTGAASSLNVAGFVAGVGAFAAFFL